MDRQTKPTHGKPSPGQPHTAPHAEHDPAKGIVDLIDRLVVPLVWYSIIMLTVECHLFPGQNSRQGHAFFLWSERVVAMIFTIEYAVRWYRNSGRGFYPITAFGVIDLLAILPFWMGFLPGAGPHLHLIRTLRVLRMLKFFRYSRGLQLMTLGFYRAYFNLKPLLMTAAIIVLFAMFSLYEVEGPHQEEFRNLFTVGWFLEVTGTTVGYGDLSPQTTAGKAIVMIFMIAGLAIFGACFSAITTAFDRVFEEAANVDCDPLEEFEKVREEQEAIEEAFKDTGTTDADDEAYEEALAEEQPANKQP